MKRVIKEHNFKDTVELHEVSHHKYYAMQDNGDGVYMAHREYALSGEYGHWTFVDLSSSVNHLPNRESSLNELIAFYIQTGCTIYEFDNCREMLNWVCQYT